MDVGTYVCTYVICTVYDGIGRISAYRVSGCKGVYIAVATRAVGNQSHGQYR